MLSGEVALFRRLKRRHASGLKQDKHRRAHLKLAGVRRTIDHDREVCLSAGVNKSASRPGREQELPLLRRSKD